MKTITETINESKVNDNKNLLKILKDDTLSQLIMTRTEHYDANKLSSSRDVKFLLEHKNGKHAFLGADKLVLEDFEHENEVFIGVYIDRMYYPISDRAIAIRLWKELTK